MSAPQHDPADVTGERIPLTKSEISSADDWHGLADAKERRKRQNRLNQRRHREEARRRRHANAQSNSRHLLSPTITAGQLHQVEQNLNGHQAPDEKITELEDLAILAAATVPQSSTRSSSRDSQSCADQFSSAPHMMTLWFAMPWPHKRKALIEQLATYHNSYVMNCPLSNHLLTLTKMNVHRAFVSNMVTLGITWEWMQEDSISPFYTVGPAKEVLPTRPTLIPTTLQRRSEHHTWIDLFPCPIMRDNLVRAGNEWDDDDLCADIMGFWNGGSPDPQGLIVWGDPSDIGNWELQPGFVTKWGWIVRGCSEIIRATNQWRAKRGERPLFAASFLASA
ncbi:hypothetical protein N7494_011049 [Penicillium frequentans]|uniref:BZIP domain-containing protein n=1 Tax=Penicillium frequentans TaxID=3151616 RepID=A0AAD6CLK3_9EURO|nr:hypothetical protein N7494_011049 [Penicillium glabrum]